MGIARISGIKALKESYQISQGIVVADTVMMTESNIAELDANGLQYIIGGKLKSRSKSLQDQVVDMVRYAAVIPGYQVARFTDDNGKMYLSNHGYKKYLKISGKSTVEPDQDKIDQASKWDRLLGVCTNVTQLSDGNPVVFGLIWRLHLRHFASLNLWPIVFGCNTNK